MKEGEVLAFGTLPPNNTQAKQRGQVGITLVCMWYRPYDESKPHMEAATRALDFMLAWYMEPLVHGDYPFNMTAIVRDRLPTFSKEEAEMIKGSYDFIGINYYTARYARKLKEKDGVPIGPSAILHCCQRFCTTGLPSDVSVEVEEISFHLHKDNYQEYLMLRAQVECLQRSQRISISFVLEGGDGQKLQSVESLLFDLATIKDAIDNFSEANKLGQGGFGPVYKKIDEYRQCARRGQAEKEFKVEVEAIGKVRHKNLVGLLGYCAEATKRLLVYEYVDNGTLEQWLHGDVGTFSPLTWDIRMKIALDWSSTLLNVVCCQCIFRRSQMRI
ncbi:hypothetical protein J5N97_021040 [Dioscorea zingiberensis]|uniref:Protein kinase domain-containing protein n=1 Tax=Dioscorea zingiberensis TaxID=325984 RepID=A0A9D5HDW0_9LILI|nr:hypothetical protein J5N97_021040 [Dioscorea zingiberensis]